LATTISLVMVMSPMVTESLVAGLLLRRKRNNAAAKTKMATPMADRMIANFFRDFFGGSGGARRGRLIKKLLWLYTLLCGAFHVCSFYLP